MPDKLILHVGIHKTATTALQDLMTLAVPAVAPGQAYWFPREDIRQRMIQPLRDGDVGPLVSAVKDRPEPVVYVSEENIAGFIKPQDGAFYPKLGERVQMIAEAFAETELHIIAVVRDWASFLPSAYIEYLRFWPFVSFKEFLGMLDDDALRFDRILCWRGALPENASVRVVPYETERGGGLEVMIGLMRSIGDLPEIPAELASQSSKVVRQGLSAGEIAAASVLGSFSPKLASTFIAKLSGDKAARLKERFPIFGKAKFAPFTEEEELHWRKRYVGDLAALKPYLLA